MKLKQINKIYKCPICKNIYLEQLIKQIHNGYCYDNIQIFKCNKCFGEFIVEDDIK